MEFEEPSCPICYSIWDKTLRTPRILPNCGHTICTECLKKILLSQSPQCPMDSSKLPANKGNLESFPINFLAQQLLEERQNKEFCQEHNEELRLVCMTDKCKICEDCICYGNHKGHDIRSLKKIKQEASKKKKDLEDSLGRIQGLHDILYQDLNKQQKYLTAQIHKRYKSLEKLLSQKKQALLIDVENIFNKEHEYLEEIMGTSSYAQSFIEKEVSNLTFLSNQDAFKSIETDFSVFTSSFDEMLEKDTQEIFTDIASLSGYCWGATDLFEKKLKNIKFNYGRWKEIYGSLEIRLQKNKLLIPKFAAENFEVQTVFELKNDGSCLEIDNKPSVIKNLVLNKLEWEDVREVKLKVSTEDLGFKDKQALDYIWKNTPKLKRLYVQCVSKSFNEKNLISMLYLLLWRAQDLEEIKVDFSSCKISNGSFIYLCERLFSKMVNLTSLDLDLSYTEISEFAIKVLIESIEPFMKNLIYYKIYLRNLNVTDEVAWKVFVPMSNVKSCQISLGDTKVTDETLKAFVGNTLDTMEKLESLEIYFCGAAVLEETVIKLIRKLRDLKKLTLCFLKTSISEGIITEFEKVALPQMKSLRELEINLHEVSLKAKEKLESIQRMLTKRK